MPKPISTKLALPTTKMKPASELHHHNVAIFGRKGVGKSTLGSSFPNSLNFRFERGRRNIEVYQVPTDPRLRLTWGSFMDYVELFADDEQFDTAVIDSVDIAYDECLEHVCAKYNVSHPSKAGKDGPGVWDEIKMTFESTFRAIQDCGKGIVFLSHEKKREEGQADGTMKEFIDLTCKPAAGKIIKNICEFVWYYGYSGNERVLYLRNSDNSMEVACGRRDVFLQPDGVALKRIGMPTVPEGEDPLTITYDHLLKGYNNELYDFDYVPPAKETKPTAGIKKRLPVKK